jgi:hypothetical protein
MKTLTCAWIAAMLLAAAPAAASSPTYMSNGQTPNNSGSGEGRVDPLQGTIPEKDTCEQWLERARQMTEPSNPYLAERAHHEITLAHEALAYGDEHACKRHVAHALYDRT